MEKMQKGGSRRNPLGQHNEYRPSFAKRRIEISPATHRNIENIEKVGAVAKK